jgi:hypothetical protein
MAEGQNEHEDRRDHTRLSEDEFEAIAERTAEIVWEKFEMSVGRTTIRLVLYALGAGGLVLLGWLGLNRKIGP